MKKISKFLAVMMIVIISLTACAKKPNVQSGEWSDDTFTNSWSGIKLTLPEGYNILSSDEIKDVMDAGEDVLLNEGKNKIEIEVSKLQMLYDFMIKSDDELNSILLMYENAGTSNEEEYYESLKTQILDIDSLGYEDEGKSTAKIAGENYTKASFSITIPITEELEYIMYQDYYFRKYEGVMVCFIVTYNEDSKSEISDILNSVTKS